MDTLHEEYPLSTGPYAWVPSVLGVGALLGLSALQPFIVFVLPFAMVLSSVPAWVLGGRLHVHAEPGLIRLTRIRWMSVRVSSLSFPLDEAPGVEVTRPYGHKPHGVLRVTARTGHVEITQALHAALTPIATDLAAYFGPPT